MSVTGYLALYTTVLGWQQYQNLWNIMTGTGLVYLPFVGILLSSSVSPFLSMGAKDFSIIAVRRLIIHILSALIVIAVCCVPSISLNPKVLTFQPTCQPTAPIATPGDTGTTYDNAFPVPTSVQIPLMWYLVMAISNGFTHAANTGLSCSAMNYRELHAQLNLATIKSPALKQETKNFYQQCYIPAYSKYLNSTLSAAQQSQIQTIEAVYGTNDTGWLGSEVFQQVPGFYDSIQATSPVSGFPFDAARDTTEAQVSNHSQWGEPMCNNWWSTPTTGLHAKLLAEFPPSFINSLLSLGSSAASYENVAIRHLINTNVFNASGYSTLNDSDNFLSKSAFGITGDVGTAMYAIKGFTIIHLIINALPVIQAAMLFCIYAFLAIAIPFSGYKPSFIITATVVMFAVIFCSYIWHLVGWFDNHLITALYPSGNGQIGLGFFSNVYTSHRIIQEMFVNLIIGAMYVICPVFFMVILSWAGLQAGAVFGAIIAPMTAPAQAAGGAATSALKSASKLISKG